jgi:ATP:ADP antiporter, AAA family
VFVLFAVSVFWSYMADLFTAEQGKRLFAVIAAGGTAGSLAGPALTIGLAEFLGPANLMIVAAVFLEAAVLCVRRLESVSPEIKKNSSIKAEPEAIGGGMLDGFLLLVRSPYLAGIAMWVSLLSIAATFLYFQQANIVAAASDDPAVRTRLFASIDLAVGVLTLLVQAFATGRLIAMFGIGAALAFLPLVFVAGFAVLAAAPVLTVVIAFQALQRTANFAVSNPAREVLFTVVAREEKYKAKNVIDVVAVRGADAVGGWLFAALRSLGMELRMVSLVAIPIAALCLLLAAALGRTHEKRSGG